MTAEEKRLRAALKDALATLEWIVPKEQAEFGEWPEGDPEKDIVERTRAALEGTPASKRGKSNRARGHSAERDVCAWLKANGFPDAATTRSVLGSDGTRQPGDVTFAPGVVLSVKHVKTPAWPAWIRQVKEEAQQAGNASEPWSPDWKFSPRVPAVVHRLVGRTDVGEWPCAVPLSYWDDMFAVAAYDRPIAEYDALLHMFGVGWSGKGWIEHCVPTRPHVAVMRFRTFAEAFRLDQ